MRSVLAVKPPANPARFIQTRLARLEAGACAATLLAPAGLLRLGLTPPGAVVLDPEARAVSTAERALLAELDGSCRTPIGGHARLRPDGTLRLTGLVARADGSFLLRRTLQGPAADAARIDAELGASLRADSPRDIFA